MKRQLRQLVFWVSFAQHTAARSGYFNMKTKGKQRGDNMKFQTPQVNLYVESLEVSKRFYENLGFKVTFTAEVEHRAVHHELVLDGFILGIATRDSGREIHGLNTGKNSGCEIVLWTDHVNEAIQYLVENGAKMLSEPHDFLDGKLRSGWVLDPDDNPIQIVSRNEKN
jgi:predicted lactoylglutathione lyase